MRHSVLASAFLLLLAPAASAAVYNPGAPGGTSGQIQYNNGGVFGGSGLLTVGTSSLTIGTSSFSGTVGIGTNNPAYPLTVKGGTSTTAVAILNGANPSLSLRQNSDGSGAFYSYDGSGHVIGLFGSPQVYLSSAGVFAFSNSTTSTATIDTDITRQAAGVVAIGTSSTVGDYNGTLIAAKVGIGTNSVPTYPLTVNGNVSATTYYSGATAGVTCSGSPTASFATTNGIVTHC